MPKLIARIAITFCTLTLTFVSAPAATISISNLTDGPPVITTDIQGPTITLAFEEARITLSVLLGTNPAIAPGTRSVIFSEPASDPNGPRVSDFITMIASPAIGGVQVVALFFQSDGALAFDQNVGLLPAGTPSLVETGALQDVSGSNFLNTSPALTVNVASDLGGPEIPEPGTLLLMGAGLVAVVFLRGYRRG